MQRLMSTEDLLWPACDGPEDLARIEEIPLPERGLPDSTYEIVARAAELWPDRPALSFFPDAARFKQSSTRTFGQLAADVHRAAHVLRGLGVDRRDAVVTLSVNCEELVSTLLAAEAVGIAAPINPALATDHAQHLVELSGARVVVAGGPELDPMTWERARTDSDGMQHGGGKHGERRRIGIILQLAPLLRQSETRFEVGVEHAKSFREGVSDLGIFERLGDRGSDHEAAAGQAVARKVNRELTVIGPHEGLAQGLAAVRQGLVHHAEAEPPITFERLEVELVLVPERRIEARSVHSGRGADLVERGAGIATLPEPVRCALQGGLRVVGAWPTEAFRHLSFILYHFE